MAATLGVFNANNFFLRYKFGRTFPGDMSKKSFEADPQFGFVPQYSAGLFQPYNPKQVALCAKAIKSTGDLPDVLCLSEVENILALRVFNNDHLKKHYSHALLVDSYDLRQIDVGVLSRFPILAVRSHVDDLGTGNQRTFSRDCLEVTLGLNKSGSKTLTLFINHFKSKFVDTKGKSKAAIAAEIAKADAKREAQAKAVRSIVRERFPGTAFGKAFFAVVGDLNAAPAEKSVAPIVRQADLHNVVDDLPEAERWTYWWKAKNRASQIDYILVSPTLHKAVVSQGIKPRIERRGIGFRNLLTDGKPGPKQTNLVRDEGDASGLAVDFRFKRFGEVTEKLVASDHCPLFLELPI